MTLRYGVNVNGIRKSSDITGLYTAILPVGTDNLMISALDKTELDADGRVEYRSAPGDGCIRAVQAMERFPSNLKTDDRYILKRWSYDTANVNVLYQKHIRQNPQLASNPVSRWQQKRAIRKQYAAAKRAGQSAGSTVKTAENVAKAAKKAAEETKKTAGFIWRHKKGFLIVIGLFLVVCIFLNGMSSCSMLAEGVMSGLGGSTHPSSDEAMLGAEAAYAGMENELQSYLDSYESTHDYDEYSYDLDDIGHDPYVLMALLNAYHRGGWTLEQVQGTLEMLFERQYTLTETVTVETAKKNLDVILGAGIDEVNVGFSAGNMDEKSDKSIEYYLPVLVQKLDVLCRAGENWSHMLQVTFNSIKNVCADMTDREKE